MKIPKLQGFLKKSPFKCQDERKTFFLFSTQFFFRIYACMYVCVYLYQLDMKYYIPILDNDLGTMAHQ